VLEPGRRPARGGARRRGRFEPGAKARRSGAGPRASPRRGSGRGGLAIGPHVAARAGLHSTQSYERRGSDDERRVQGRCAAMAIEVRRWLEAGAKRSWPSLLELLHEARPPFASGVEASEREENERLRGVTYERTSSYVTGSRTSERQAEHLRPEHERGCGGEGNERHQKEREDAAERLKPPGQPRGSRNGCAGPGGGTTALLSRRPGALDAPTPPSGEGRAANFFVRSLARGARQGAGIWRREFSGFLRAGSRWQLALHPSPGLVAPAQKLSLWSETRDRDRREASRAPRGRRGGTVAHELARLARSREYRISSVASGRSGRFEEMGGAFRARPWCSSTVKLLPSMKRARHAPVHSKSFDERIEVS